ncbi:ABC transporter ATP-binding protein, partial [Candidatus Saccharibacteria bacterium]|nr:ABC transporter ATP-binding protein [Candidatus Saccharibacteria bacterium]
MKHILGIIRISKSLNKYYVIISIASILVSVLGMAIPFLSGQAIDEIRLGQDANTIKVVWLVVFIFLADLLTTLISNGGAYIGDQMSEQLQRLLSTKYYQHILGLSQTYFDKELSGKIINRLSRSIDRIAFFMQMLSNNFLQFIFSTILALAIIAFYSWSIALLLFALYPIYIWMTIRASGKWMDYQVEKNGYRDDAVGRFSESINQIKVVKSFVQEARELKYFEKKYNKVVKVNKPQSKLWHVKDIQRRLVLNVIFLGVYLLIFLQASQGMFTPGQAVTLILYAMQIRIPIFTISFLVEHTQRAVADSKEYFEVLNEEPLIKDADNAVDIKVTDGVVKFEDVSFGYGEELVLKGVSFEILQGQKVALVGESGEGKTTLTNLLMRLYEPSNGRITIDGQDISEVTQASLRSEIGVVFQDPSLFSGTIQENISYYSQQTDMKDVIKASKAANAHGFVSKLEDDYATNIGERGLKLSGGQKQRIAIARALMKNPPILILDEATSSLDSRSEQLVQQALDKLMQGRTTIIIAHRLSTIKNVDKIITIQNGKVDEIGSP